VNPQKLLIGTNERMLSGILSLVHVAEYDQILWVYASSYHLIPVSFSS